MGRDCILDWWRCISEKRKVFREISNGKWAWSGHLGLERSSDVNQLQIYALELKPILSFWESAKVQNISQLVFLVAHVRLRRQRAEIV